jgi:hypothetical protein
VRLALGTGCEFRAWQRRRAEPILQQKLFNMLTGHAEIAVEQQDFR